jgi:hypothetical protein
MCAAQRASADAASLWHYENERRAELWEAELGYPLAGKWVFVHPNTLFYDVRKRYPGALDGAFPDGSISAEDVRQAMWSYAGDVVADLVGTAGTR